MMIEGKFKNINLSDQIEFENSTVHIKVIRIRSAISSQSVTSN